MNRQEQRRKEWADEMRRRGKMILSEAEYHSLSDTVSLVALAIRRQASGGTVYVSDEMKRLRELYDDLRDKQSRCVSYLDFDREKIAEESPLADNVVLFSEMLKR